LAPLIFLRGFVMYYEFEKISEEHRKSVVDIFNYFIENGYAAYPEEKVPYEFFDMLLKIAQEYPAIVVTDNAGRDKIIGFAFMRPYHPMKAFKRTAEVSYFLLPEFTRRGIGKTIIEFFIMEAKKINIDTLLADISSLNEQSIKFHEKMGFSHCGRFQRVGRKFEKNFDVIWMQKLL
jgi:L-amino acid N-acyltransferase YncA